jgi:hypothetical protein
MNYINSKIKLAIVSLLIIISQGLDAQNANCFTPFGTYGASTNPEVMTSADFNHDGKLDIAAINNTSNNVSVLLGVGTGSFLATVNYTVGSGPSSVVADDFNNDGHIDLAVSNYNSNNITILLGSNTGTFSTYGFYPVGARPISIIMADLNNDGESDLVTTNITSSNVSVLIGVGNGGFFSAVNYTAGASPISVSAADFNNDAKLDLAVANLGTNDVTLLLGSSSGTFIAAGNFTVGSSPISITSNDFNSDGNSDVAVVNSGSNDLFVLMGNGSGTFTTTLTYAVGTSPYFIISKELNGDGMIDLAVANNASQNISILLGTGTGTFAPAVNIANGTTPYSLISADFNNDNRADLAVANVFLNTIGIYLNDPSLFLNSTTNEVCTGKTITLSASGASSYSWSTGVTTTSIAVSPTIQTTYTVVGTNTVNGCSNTSVKTISVNPNPIITVSSGSVCPGKSFTISPSGASTYTYSSGISIVTPTINSTYTISGSSLKGCVDSVECLVTVNPTPTISVNSGSICAGESFSMSPSGANTYTYSNGVAIVTPTANTTYSISGTDLNGCMSSVNAVSHVTVNPLPIITISTTNTLLCAGETATVSALGAISYTWSNSATTPTIVVSPTLTIVYVVDGTDVNGCTNTASISQNVSACAGIMMAEAFETTLRVYPNPNNGLFIIEINTLSQLVITNALGKSVLNKTIETGSHNLSIQNQPPGVYFLKIIQLNKEYMVKLIKE